MAQAGWKALIESRSQRRRHGPIIAYSEFMPPPRPAGKVYPHDPFPFFDEDDPFGWPVTEAEELLELQPGLQHVAGIIVHAVASLAAGHSMRGMTRKKLTDNPAWPETLASHTAGLPHERFLTLMPLALSRTQDDKGRVRWTVFGGSERGPGWGFWRSFWLTPRKQAPASVGEGFIRRLLHDVYGISEVESANLKKAGFRVLPQSGKKAPWIDGELPRWIEPYLWTPRTAIHSVKFLLTFRPFSELPEAIQSEYLAGRLHLLPCPHSLLFWGARYFQRLAEQLPDALQISLLQLLPRTEAVHCLRIPQSGWMHEPHPDHPAPDDPALPLHNTYRRTHRWARIHRTDDELAVTAKEDKLAHVLFSTAGDDIELYGKPMARNIQLWDHHFQSFLDGPRTTPDQLAAAAKKVRDGGLFGYRFQFPPMRVGRHEVFWHRPLVAYRPIGSADVRVFDDAPLGVIVARPASDGKKTTAEIELWPRPKAREPQLQALSLFHTAHDPHPYVTSLNVQKIFRARDLRRKPLPKSLARQLLSHHHDSFDDWLASLPSRSDEPELAKELIADIEACLEKKATPPPEPRTFDYTANRNFEIRYWKQIAQLAEGHYINKSNADCVLDPKTQAALKHHHRDLDALGDFVIRYYEKLVQKSGLGTRAFVGELPFVWKTDFDFSWMGGWLHNQEGKSYERNLICAIPGRDRKRAVIMADHYDTAYMEDRFYKDSGGDGVRIAAAGADDNHSATAACMLAAPIFLEMSRRGKLGCDVWLIHLTGEEFPSDCLGARHLAQSVLEGRVHARTRAGREHEFKDVRIQGLYVMDMIAHNKNAERDIFQIAPGAGRQSLWLAEQAHLANEAWNAGTRAWNARPARRGLGRAQRSPHGDVIPAPAAHLALSGEVRLPFDPRSTLYNTDGQIFADAGIPCVLFMENYDISRVGYHDMHDTMENIDLDYGAALAAIAIESVARAACEKPPK